jgi:hypothetical protein
MNCGRKAFEGMAAEFPAAADFSATSTLTNLEFN